MGILFPRPPGIGQAERPLFPIAGAVAAHAVLLLMVATVVPTVLPTEALTQTLKPMAVRLVEILPELPKPQTARPPRPAQPRPALPPAAAPVLTSNAPGETPASFVVPVQAAQAAPARPMAAAAVAPAITAARFDADYLDNPQPIYPHASRRLGEQGKVLLRVYVSAAGLAEKVELKLGSGFARLDRAAQEAVGRWRFVPARRGEQTIAAWVQVPITFQLES